MGHFLGRSGVILGSVRDHFGNVLESFWHRFGVVLTPFWAIFVPFLGHFRPSLAHFYGHFLVMFWGVASKIEQNDAKEGKNIQISAKIHQKYAKVCKKTKPYLAYKTLVLL